MASCEMEQARLIVFITSLLKSFMSHSKNPWNLHTEQVLANFLLTFPFVLNHEQQCMKTLTNREPETHPCLILSKMCKKHLKLLHVMKRPYKSRNGCIFLVLIRWSIRQTLTFSDVPEENSLISFICTSRWRECGEENDHHRGDPVLQINGTGLPEWRNVH